MAFLSLLDLLRVRAAQAPRALALLAPRRQPLTYSALLLQVEQTVARLRALGVGLQDRVALVLPNGPELAVAVLATASAATALPLRRLVAIS